MTGLALLFTLAAIGLSETSYLVRKRQHNEHAECPIGGGCTIVLESKYNRTLGVHNDVLGIVFYAAMMVVTALHVLDIMPVVPWAIATNALLVGAVLMSMYFVTLQKFVIRAWCFWCLLSTATIFFMTLIVFIGGRS